jgi:hypothetical protein
METKIKSQSIARYSSGAVLNFFNGFGSSLIECDYTNGKVLIDGGKLYITFGSATSSGVTYWYVYRQDGTLLISFNPYTSNSYPVWACISDTFLFCKVWGNGSAVKGSILYEKMDSGDFGGVSSSMSIRSNTLYDMADYSKTYTHPTPMLNYTANLGTIDYTSEFLNDYYGELTNIEDSNLKTITTMTTGQSITVDGKNYYVLESNLMIPLNNEGD